MMKLLFLMVFMIPMMWFSFVLVQYLYMLMYLYLLFSGCYMYMCSVSYSFGIDNFSYCLIMLMIIISSLMVISMVYYDYISLFMLVNLSLSFLLMIIFSSLNFLYMYISFEFVLLPLLVLILGWGYQPERLLAGMYLFFYTLLVSLPLLILILYMYNNTGSLFFDYLKYYSDFYLLHFIMMMVFMVKLPMYLVHFWLPKAHVQAPVSGSMILAGLMLKIGGYGLIRLMYVYENLNIQYSYILFSLSMVGSVTVSLICLIQADMKCLIAYSSISHMGMVIMGIMTMGSWGLVGSYLLMLGHGFCSSGLFYISNLFYMRTSSRSFYVNKGMLMYMPSCSMFMFLLCSFNMSCPPSISFISEIMILSSMINFWSWSIYFFSISSFMCACFSYYLYSYSQHGLYHNLYSFSYLNLLEFLCLLMHLVPLCLMPLMVIIVM